MAAMSFLLPLETSGGTVIVKFIWKWVRHLESQANLTNWNFQTGCQSAALPSAIQTITSPAETAAPSRQTDLASSTITPLIAKVVQNPQPSQPTITAGPTLVSRDRLHQAEIFRRDAPVPEYLSEYQNVFSHFFIYPACSCLITSAYPVSSYTTTVTVPKWTASTVSWIPNI